METTKYNEFVKTVVETYVKLSGGERKRFRELLKRHDTYIRHVQRFNNNSFIASQGDFNGNIFRDDTSGSGEVLLPVLGERSSDREGAVTNLGRVEAGAALTGLGVNTGGATEMDKGQESVISQEQPPQA